VILIAMNEASGWKLRWLASSGLLADRTTYCITKFAVSSQNGGNHLRAH
jgi:hypothetical protein